MSENIFPVHYSSLSTKALLELVINKYSLPAISKITYLKRGFNDTYLITSSENKYILRVYKHNWRSIESIESELNLLNYLKTNDISVSYPMGDNNRQTIQTINAPEGTRYAVLFSYAEGKQVRKLNKEQAYLLGIETAKIHLIGKQLYSSGFKINPAHDYTPGIQFEITLSALQPFLIDYPEQYDYLLELKQDFENTFDNVNKNELPQGYVHGDLQAENFHLTDDNQFTFFDFDFFGTGYLAYDIGVFIWYDHKSKPPEIIKTYLEGYESIRPLIEAEKKLLPYFSTLRAIFQMTLYCKISDGQNLPLWTPAHVAQFINKVKDWHEKGIKYDK